MYAYQIVFEHPSCRRKRSVLQVLSRRHHASVVALLKAEGLYAEFRDWLLVDFRVASENDPKPEMERVTEELPASGAILDLVA
jgi:hypothetical protein